jgi:hypothetical protein
LNKFDDLLTDTPEKDKKDRKNKILSLGIVLLSIASFYSLSRFGSFDQTTLFILQFITKFIMGVGYLVRLSFCKAFRGWALAVFLPFGFWILLIWVVISRSDYAEKKDVFPS